ncbi:MAG: PDDEXK nuclease domain-containing protein [Treponema sp.]|nr:PDDEXK nuclease domain-containing protein [Treponema sp.]
MDMFVSMYDELKYGEVDNLTIGILFCSETYKDIARYSILKGNEYLFASKYKLYLPTETEVRTEIIKEKKFIRLQLEENRQV